MADKHKKLKILLIEDNGIFFNIVSELLENQDVAGVQTVAAGLEKYKQFKPDITLLDLTLPDGSGHDLLVDIKNYDKNAYVVIMTASRLKEDILQSMKEGAQGYVVKPFSGEILNQCIKEYYEHVEIKS